MTETSKKARFFLIRPTNATIWFEGCADRDQRVVLEDLHRGLRTALAPIEIRRLRGKRLPDFLWVGLCPLISDRVHSGLTMRDLRGWSTYPVSVRDDSGTPILGYRGLQVYGRCDSIRVDRTRVEYKSVPSGREMAYYTGLVIDETSWDQSDCFTASDNKTLFVLVTDRVQKTLQELKTSNVDSLPIEKYSFLTAVQISG